MCLYIEFISEQTQINLCNVFILYIYGIMKMFKQNIIIQIYAHLPCEDDQFTSQNSIGLI